MDRAPINIIFTLIRKKKYSKGFSNNTLDDGYFYNIW